MISDIDVLTHVTDTEILSSCANGDRKLDLFVLGLVKPLEDISVAVNHFYDGSHTTTEYRTRGSRLNNMVSRVSVALESYDSEYGTLMQMVSAYGDKLKAAKGLIDDRMDALAEYNAKKKAANSIQGKEGKDPTKVKAATDKYQAAKDAFDSADAKATRELTTIFEDACAEFEECYTKFLRVQSNLFMTAGAALGGAELPTSTMQYSVTGSDEAPRKVYKEELKEEKKAAKREKKEEKKEEKRKRRGTVATAPSHSSRNDVFEPNDDRPHDEPPPSLSTPPMEPRSPRATSQQRSSMAMANGGAPPPLPGGRPAPSSPRYDDYDTTSYDSYGAPPPSVPPRSDSSEIVTGLDLIGRDVPVPSLPQRPPPAVPPSDSHSSFDSNGAPPSLPSGRPRPTPSDDSYGGFSSSGGPPPLPSYNAGGPPALPSPNHSSGGPPALPAQNSSSSLGSSSGGPPPLPGSRSTSMNDAPPPSLPPSRYRSGSISQESSEPPSLPERARSGSVSSNSRPSLHPVPLIPASAAPAVPASNEPKPIGKLPSPRHGIQVLPPIASTAPQDSQPSGPPSLPGRNRAPSIPSSAPSTSSSGPPALPSGRSGAPPSIPPTSTNGAQPPSLPGRSPSSSISGGRSPSSSVSSGGPPKLPSSQHPTPLTPSTSAASTSAPAPLAIPSDEIQKYGLIFNREDTDQNGHITGKQAFTLFSRSKLPSIELAQIWELSDQDKDGTLTRDEFIIAMWYINSRLKQHIAVVPKEVHPSLVLKQYPGCKLPNA